MEYQKIIIFLEQKKFFLDQINQVILGQNIELK